jgi:capsular polysaccharide biosynthesis protein
MSLILDLKHTLKAFKKYLWILIVFFVIGSTASFVNSTSHGVHYTATSSFIVGANISSSTKLDYYAYAISHQLVYTCNNLITSNKVLSDAVAIAGDKINPVKLADAIQTRISQGSDYIEFDVTANSSLTAVSLSNAVMQSLNNQLSMIDTAIPIKITVIDKPVITATSGSTYADIKSGLLGGIAGIFVALALILIITAASAKRE